MCVMALQWPKEPGVAVQSGIGRRLEIVCDRDICLRRWRNDMTSLNFRETQPVQRTTGDIMSLTRPFALERVTRIELA